MENKLTKKELLLEQVKLAITEVSELQRMLDNVFIQEKINLDSDNELTRVLCLLEFIQSDIIDINLMKQ